MFRNHVGGLCVVMHDQGANEPEAPGETLRDALTCTPQHSVHAPDPLRGESRLRYAPRTPGQGLCKAP
jgi:hypothetical protein